MIMISLEEIEKLSELSRIKLSPREKKNFQKDLEGVLNYFNKLKSLDTSKAGENEVSNRIKNKPCTTILPNNAETLMRQKVVVRGEFREDELIKKLEEKEFENFLEQAPRKEKGYVKVKKII